MSSQSNRYPAATILPFEGYVPEIDLTAFIAPGAILIGRVVVRARASIWYGCILRGDNDDLIVDEDSNIQDASVLHAEVGLPTIIGKRVTIGHGAIVHGATIHDDVLIGMRASVLNGVEIGSHSLVAAGAVVTPSKVVPQRSLVAGVPAKVIGEIRDKDVAVIERTAPSYVDKAQRHRHAIVEYLAKPAREER